MNREQNRQLLIGLLALGWLLSAFIGYIYIHKPFSTAELSGILLSIWRTLIAITIISIAGGIGFLTGLRKLDLHPFALAMLTAAFGCGMIGISVLLLGVTIGINFFLWIILISVGIVLRKQVLAWWKCWQPIGEYWQNTSGFGKTILFLTVIILVGQYIVALAPPLQFDALTYHLAIPKAYIQIGHIAYLPDTVFWGMPQLIEMLYTLSMLIGGTEAATVLGWWIGALTLAGLVGIAEKIFGRDSAWVAVASLMCASGLMISISSGYVEWATILFGLSMSICLMQWLLSKDRSILVLAGVFAGMALGTKYTAGVALLAGLSVILLFQRPDSLKQVVANMMLFGGMAVVLTLPWWIKNILATSNPFYPLLIPAGAMDATSLAMYQAKPLTQDWSRLLLLPWQITVWGIDGGEGYSVSIGPLLLGLSPLALINWRQHSPEQRRMIKTCGTILLAGLLIWAVVSQFSALLSQTRLYFVIFPVWAVLCAAGYAAVSKLEVSNIRFGNILAAFIVMALVFNTFFTTINVFKTGAALAALNPEKREDYLKNNHGAYELAMESVNALPENTHVVMLWETRGFACQPKCDPDEIILRWPSNWASYHNPAAIIKAWKELGYTHMLINRSGADFVRKYYPTGYNPETWAGLNTLLAALPLVKSIAGSYEIYSLP